MNAILGYLLAVGGIYGLCALIQRVFWGYWPWER